MTRTRALRQDPNPIEFRAFLAALASLHLHPDFFNLALLAGHDFFENDLTLRMVGLLAGAYQGEKAIPADLKRGISHLPGLIARIRRRGEPL